MRKHIKYLLDLEETTQGRYAGGIRFDRVNDNTIVVSCEGYIHQKLMDAEEALLKFGCRYDVKRGIQEFDRMCGRTFTYFTEPKEDKAVSNE